MGEQYPPSSDELPHMFTPGIGRIATAGGSQLVYDVGVDRIQVTDHARLDAAGHFYFIFAAGVTFSDELRTMTFTIRTRHSKADPALHPELRGGVLVGQAINYFDTSAARPLDAIKARWSGRDKGMTTNYDQYWQALEGIPNPTLDQCKQAAAGTWTGNLACAHGFTTITSPIYDETDEVTTYFIRNDAAVRR